MKSIILSFSFLALIACNSNLAVMGNAPAAQEAGNTEIFALSRLKANAGDLVKVSGLNLTPGMIVQIGGKTVKLKILSDSSASFIMPDTEGAGDIGATFMTKDSQSLGTLALVSNSENARIPVMDVDPGLVCLDITYQDPQGRLKVGARNCSSSLPLCGKDGDSACVASQNFRAINVDTLDSEKQNIRAGRTIAGVSGTLSDCLNDGSTACVATPAFPSMLAIGAEDKILIGQALGGAHGNLVLPLPSKVLAGTGFGVLGLSLSGTLTLPSDCTAGNQSGCVATPSFKTMNLTAAGTDTGLTSTNFNATVRASGNFEFWDALGARYSVAGDTDLTAGNIKGSVSIFGVTGDYPSATYKLANNTTATDLTTFASQITTDGAFEFFDSAGTKYTGSGDSDLIAANVRTGTAIESLSITGTMPAILPAPPTPFTTAFFTTPDRVILSWANTGAAGYLVVARAGTSVTFNPTRTTTYTSGAQGSDTILYVGTGTSFTHSGVTASSIYHYAVYSYDANHFYSATPATAVGSVISCSGLAGGSWVAVPGDSTYGTSDFCAMKYEAKNVSGVATSEAALTPWVSISQITAQSTCQALGANFDLISNAEWLTLGANIANVASNWSTGIVGSGYLNRGHSDNSPASACAASTDDTLGFVQTDCTPKNSSGDVFNQKRTHNLSTGGIIWDLAGNVWDWTNFVIPDTSAKPYASVDGAPVGVWREYGSINSGFSVLNLSALLPRNAQKSFWNDIWNSAQGTGQYYAGVSGSGGALLRGALWFDGSTAGLFSGNLSFAPTSSGGGLGFRCVFRPPSL